jgi:phenylpropionate dioxygenase-like ring-hydroxylating dioxygenase large terminal subunit
MDGGTQRALLQRIEVHRQAGRGTDRSPMVVRNHIDAYRSPRHLEHERQSLFSDLPLVAALSPRLPTPGSWATVDLDGRPVVLTRDAGGEVRALLNVCRHRGAPVAQGDGCGHSLVCGYHGWSYHLDGTLAVRRRAPAFGDVDPAEAGLCELPAAEHAGVILVRPTPGPPLDAADWLGGVADELAPLGLDGYHLFGTRRFTRPLNWKLAVDTFTEAWHLGVLHQRTLDPLIFSDFALFDALGPHGRLVAARRSVAGLDEVPEADRSLLPHATILWFLVPNTVLIHQQDHVQLYQSWPGDSPDEAHLTVSVYVPAEPRTEREIRHWQRNFDLLVDVTDGEDFALAAAIQHGYHSGAQDFVRYGRNEPALAHYHQALRHLMGLPPLATEGDPPCTSATAPSSRT